MRDYLNEPDEEEEEVDGEPGTGPDEEPPED